VGGHFYTLLAELELGPQHSHAFKSMTPIVTTLLNPPLGLKT
jgi:hypothetical protein